MELKNAMALLVETGSVEVGDVTYSIRKVTLDTLTPCTDVLASVAEDLIKTGVDIFDFEKQVREGKVDIFSILKLISKHLGPLVKVADLLVSIPEHAPAKRLGALPLEVSLQLLIAVWRLNHHFFTTTLAPIFRGDAAQDGSSTSQ